MKKFSTLCLMCVVFTGCVPCGGIEEQNDLDEPGEEVVSAVCGDGVIEAPERCDGDCPETIAACPVMEFASCTKVNVVGAAATCDAVCDYVQQVECVDADGCCPLGCSPCSSTRAWMVWLGQESLA